MPRIPLSLSPWFADCSPNTAISNQLMEETLVREGEGPLTPSKPTMPLMDCSSFHENVQEQKRSAIHDNALQTLTDCWAFSLACFLLRHVPLSLAPYSSLPLVLLRSKCGRCMSATRFYCGTNVASQSTLFAHLDFRIPYCFCDPDYYFKDIRTYTSDHPGSTLFFTGSYAISFHWLLISCFASHAQRINYIIHCIWNPTTY